MSGVAYVLFGYPLVIRFLGRRRQQPAAATYEPTVAIVVAAYNEEETILQKLENIFDLEYPHERLEVVVAAQGSTDRTAAVAAAFDSRVVVLESTERQGKLAAVEAACAHASSEVIVLSDANNLYTPDTLKHLVAPFHDPTVGAVSGVKMSTVGPDALAAGEGFYWRYEKAIKQSEARFASCTSASGEILAVRADIMEPLPADAGLDDFERICSVLRNGYRVDFAEGAISLEPTSASEVDERERRARITAQRWRLIARPGRFPLRRPLVMWQIVSHKIGRLLLPFMAMAALVSNAAEVARGGGSPRGRRSARRWLAAQLGFYVLALAGPRLRLKGRAGKLVNIPRYLVVTNAATLQGLFLALKNDQLLWDRVERYQDGDEG